MIAFCELCALCLNYRHALSLVRRLTTGALRCLPSWARLLLNSRLGRVRWSSSWAEKHWRVIRAFLDFPRMFLKRHHASCCIDQCSLSTLYVVGLHMFMWRDGQRIFAFQIPDGKKTCECEDKKWENADIWSNIGFMNARHAVGAKILPHLS